MRTFTSTLGCEYKFVELQSQSQVKTVNGENIPFFLAPDNSPLDKFYQKIAVPVTIASQGEPMLIDPYTKFPYYSVFHPQDLPQLNLPNIKDFDNKEQYDSALLTWFCQANKYLLSVILPTPITSCFYVPSPPKIFTHEEKTNLLRYKTFKANVWPLLPKNYLHMIDLLLSNEPIYPNIPFPEQIPNREPILYLHHITHEQQWMGQMIPLEPKPFIYDNIEDYEKAYENWSIITFDNLKQPPIPPNQFGEIASLQCYHKSKSEENTNLTKTSFKKRRKYPMKIPKKAKLLVDLQWANKTNIQSKTTISTNLQKLYNSLPSAKKLIVDPEPVIDVFGIKDKKEFVHEMIDYGYHSDSLNLNKPIHPTYFLLGSNISSTNSIDQLLENPKNYSISTFYKILDADFTKEQYATILSKSVNDHINGGHVIVANLVDSYLNNQQKVMYLLYYTQRTLRHSIRLSYFFRSLFNLNSSNELFLTIIQPSYIVLFYHIISVINITSNPKIPLVPMIRNFKNTPLMKINHLYLLQTFLILFNENDNPQFYQKILEKLRPFFSSVYRSLAKQETFLNSLRDAPADTDEYKALLMLIQCESPSIHQLVLGDRFIIWLNQGPKRPTLLWTIAHSTSMLSASYLFLKNCSNISKLCQIDSLKTNICLFISSICKYVYDNAESFNIRFNGKNLIQFFVNFLSCSTIKIFLVLESISILLSSYNIISDFSSWEYRQLLADAINTICKSIVTSSHSYYMYNRHDVSHEFLGIKIYVTRIKALLNFVSYYDSILPSILQINDFIETITQFLNVPNEKVLRITWKFFRKFTQDANVLENILKRQKVQQNLSSIFNKNNKISQSKMLKFAANVWANADPKYLPSKKYLCDIFNPVITLIINAYTVRFTIYKDEVIIIKRIKEFFDRIEQLSTVPGCQEFAQRVIRRVHDDISNMKSQVK